jgi:glycosyltransferase involved in cell wall biosynthesis
MRRMPNPRRIAFVTDAIYPFNMGGKEKRLHEIATRLVKPDQEVHIYTMKWWDGPNDIFRDGLHLHAISKLYPLYTGERRSMKEAIMFGLATFKLLFAQFDVIDVDSMPFFPIYSARIVCWLRFKNMNATWHEVTPLDTWQSYVGKVAGLVAFTVERAAAYLPDRIIANSNLTTNRLLASGVRCPIDTVPLGVDAEYIYSAKAARIKSDVMFTGRLLSHKSADVLVKAIAIVAKDYPKIKCTIVGDGPERANIEQLVKDLDLTKNVRMLGFIDDAGDLYSLMKSSKMFVLPSTREGFGIVVIEANAAGLPVITTNHPNNNARNLITEGVNGYLADATPEAIAASIAKVLENGKSLTPRANVAYYDWKHIAVSVEHALGV